jgi:hypothetical protein
MSLTTIRTSNLDPNNGLLFRNRIINGDMRIDQRNAGASVVGGNSVYPVDRFNYQVGGTTDQLAFTGQQVTDAPTGFINSVKTTVTTAESAWEGAEIFAFRQFIEGTNVADLAWGTAYAQTVTLSFWVKSSLTGTFGGSLRNSDNTRSYPYSYTISSANTWEQKLVTIVGDTTGTWLTTTGTGIQVNFCLGAGPDRVATAGSWQGLAAIGVTGQVMLGSTVGATFYITGVQLEKGTSATAFEYRPYTTELQLCQRYYEKSYSVGTVPNTVSTADSLIEMGTSSYSNSVVYNYITFKVTKRAAPSVTPISYLGVSGKWEYGRSGVTNSAADCEATSVGQNSFNIRIPIGAAWTVAYINGHYTANAEL